MPIYKILVIGSCQARALAINLNNSYLNISAHSIELNETKLTTSEIKLLFNDYDLILCVVLDEDKWKSLQVFNLIDNDKVILFPRIYFTGYHPDIYELSESESYPLASDHSKLMIASLQGRINKNDLMEMSIQDACFVLGAEENYHKSLNILIEKESYTNVRISDEIVNNNNLQALLTHRHPSINLFNSFLYQIISKIDEKLPSLIKTTRNNIDYFNDSVIFPYIFKSHLSLDIKLKNLKYRSSSYFDNCYLSFDELYTVEGIYFKGNGLLNTIELDVNI